MEEIIIDPSTMEKDTKTLTAKNTGVKILSLLTKYQRERTKSVLKYLRRVENVDYIDTAVYSF